MGHPLDGCRVKLDRAENQLDTLHKELRRIMEQDAYSATGEVHMEDNSVSIFFEEQIELPIVEWGLVIGEAVHHIRGSLDHLVCRLVERERKTPHTTHQFPILKDKTDWNRRVVNPPQNGKRGLLDFIDTKHVAAIEGFQPYTPSTGKPSLRTLQRFSNTDKHRLIHAAATWVTAAPDVQINLTYPLALKNVIYQPPGTPLGKRTEVARAYPVGAIQVNNPAHREVNVHTNLHLTTVFGEPGKEDTRMNGFRECLADVRWIVESFAPDLA